jgi:protein-L-isoaspartate O-methyltransferase
MVPIQVVNTIRKAAIAELGWAGLLGPTGKDVKPGAPGKQLHRVSRETPQGATVGRLLLALAASLALAGVLIGVNWGGAGLFYEAPEASVSPGINTLWKNEDAATLVARVETDSNELYRERARIAELIGLKDGDDVAEVGAGSGFLTEELSRHVGERGRVTAVEINEALVAHIQGRAERHALANVRAHLGLETKLNINRREGGNFDALVLAGSYHHLEYPKSMLQSMRRLLRGRGQLVIVDARKVPRASPQEVLDHVRLDEPAVVDEITNAGFALVERPAAPFLKDHYVLRFRKD